MPRPKPPAPIAVGFTVKSGWAAAVLLSGDRGDVRLLDARHVELADPAVPDARQPYHAGFGSARDEGAGLDDLVASVKRFGRTSMVELLGRYEDADQRVARAVAVVGSVVDPARIANAHIKIHALEGRLFRTVVRDALAERGIGCAVWRERDLYAAACAGLARTEPELRATLAELGRGVTGGWRAEQKAAALAAWLALAGVEPVVSSEASPR